MGFCFTNLKDIKSLDKTKAIDLICIVCKVDDIT